MVLFFFHFPIEVDRGHVHSIKSMALNDSPAHSYTSNSTVDLSHTTYFSVSPPVRLAYDSIDSNSDGQDLPPLVILHGLFGSKTNWRTLARHFHKQTGRKVTF